MYDEVVRAYEQPIKFVTGFAGSGKSTHLANNADKDTLVLTPTHKTAGVLQAKGMKHVYTIHSVLKLVPTLNKEFRKGQKMQKLKRIGDTDLKDIKHIIIDEFSMINTQIMDMLLEALPDNANVTVYGDPYQLPPVDGEPIDPLAYTDDIQELTTQHRSNAPKVVSTFMRFMYYIKDRSETDLTVNLKKGTLKTFDPKTDRILAYTNKRVLELNAQAAKMLGMPKNISYGETVFANDIEVTYTDGEYFERIYPTCISKGKFKEGSDLQEAIQRTQADLAKYNVSITSYPTCVIDIGEGRYTAYYDLDHYATAKKLKAEVEAAQFDLIDRHNIPRTQKLADWCRQNPRADGVRRRAKAWSAYLNHQNYVFSVRRPFATTVHKAQGSEFSKVFIDQTDMKVSIKKGYYEQYARLMYVALSRAINEVIII